MENRVKISSNCLKYGLCLILVLCVFTLVFFTCGIRYETNDDATLANIAAGGYGDDTIHLVYVNVIFSVLLRPLYAVSPTTNWYVIVQIILMIFALSEMIYIFVKNTDVLTGSLLGLSLLLPFATDFFYSFQYTETAAVFACAGLLIICDNFSKPSKKNIVGILLVFLGSLIRWESFGAVGILMIPVLLFEVLKLDGNKKRNAVFSFIVVFALVLGARCIDSASYHTPQWKQYKEYNAARTRFSDYKIYLMDDSETNNIGFNDVEKKQLTTWDFWDGDVFTADRIQQAADSIPPKTLSRVLAETIKDIPRLLHSQAHRYLFWCLCILCLRALRQKDGKLAFVGTMALFFVLLCVFESRERYIMRIEVITMFSVCAVGMLLLSQSDIYSISRYSNSHNTNTIHRGQTAFATGLKRYATVFTAGFLAAMCAVNVHFYKKTVMRSKGYFEYANIEETYFQQMSADKNHLYILSVESLQTMAGQDIWNPRTDDFFSNIVVCGGWTSYMPSQVNALEYYGIENIFTDVADNPVVYLGYHNIDNTLQYVQQKTGQQLCITYSGDNPFAPYQIVSVIDDKPQ